MKLDGTDPRQAGDHRGRMATSAAFFVQGLCFAVVVTRVSVLQTKFHLSNGQLTLVLLIVPVIAGVGSVLSGPLAARLGSGTVLRVAQPLVCLSLPAIGFAITRPELYVAVGLFGLFLGAVDATMNMQGAITEKRYGYSVINAFYGFWSAAGILGGLWNAAAGKLGLSLGVAFTIAGVAGLAGALVLGPSLFGKEADVAPPSEAAAKKAGIQIPWRPIIYIGLAMCCMYIGDAAVSNYSSVYMSKVQHGGKALLPLAFAAYQTMMVVGRAFGDRTVRRFGAAAVVRTGAVVAGLGLLGVVLAPTPYLAIAFFALTGLGFCVVPPMCFSATSKLDPTGSGIAISRVNVFNYVGFVLGAALVGGIAGAVGGPAGWRAAYAAPLVLTVVIIALAAGFAPGRARRPRDAAASAAEAGSAAPG
jgi:MFS family permease